MGGDPRQPLKNEPITGKMVVIAIYIYQDGYQKEPMKWT